MRVHSIVLLAVPWFGGAHNGHPADQILRWTRDTINAHAVMHFSSPPGRSSETRWSVENVSGCRIELKEAWHREASNEVFPPTLQAKTVKWDFSLNDLQPEYISSDASAGVPHVTIFAPSDVFHLKTDFQSTQGAWSSTGSERNLWMYFDSPDGDNRILVKEVEEHLRKATEACASHQR